MPNRILRDGILSSEAVCGLHWAAEVFYRRLMSVVDDYGRFHASPKLIRAACYPQQIDKVSDPDIEKWLTACVTAALVRVYPASDGKRYVQIEKFGQQVRSKSKYPPPSDDGSDRPPAIDIKCAQTPADAHVFVFGGGDVSEGGDEGSAAAQSATPPTPPPAFDGANAEVLNGKSVVPLAAGFSIPAPWGLDAEALGFKPAEVIREAEKFRQYWVSGKGSGTRRSVRGWRQSWSTWLEKAARDRR